MRKASRIAPEFELRATTPSRIVAEERRSRGQPVEVAVTQTPRPAPSSLMIGPCFVAAIMAELLRRATGGVQRAAPAARQ